MKQIISAMAFEKSILTALSLPFDYDAAWRRVQSWLNNMPEGRLYIRRDKGRVYFYEIVDGHQIYLPKTSSRIYELARKKYLEQLRGILAIIRLHHSSNASFKEWKSYSKLNSLINTLVMMIRNYEKGNLNLAKIVMTPAQYKWYTGKFTQKKIDLSSARFTNNGIPVRSKSEQNIGNVAEEYGAFYHYEERLRINVMDLVESLRDSLISINWPTSDLYYYDNKGCHWNVPAALEWMNASGSVWRAYDDRSGRITIYDDFKFLLADGEIKIWEHSGLVDKFKYRCNASEREYILKYTNAVSPKNFISTFENDIATSEDILRILQDHIIPRLWF